jgi:hypothetical protein
MQNCPLALKHYCMHSSHCLDAQVSGAAALTRTLFVVLLLLLLLGMQFELNFFPKTSHHSFQLNCTWQDAHSCAPRCNK